jgi:hypothetical protein
MADPVPGTPDLTPPEGVPAGIDVAGLTAQGEAQYAATPSGNRGSVDISSRTGTNQYPQPPTGLPAAPAALPAGTKPQAAKQAPAPAPAKPQQEEPDLNPSVSGFFKWAWNGVKQGVESAAPALVGGAAETANIFLGMPTAKAADAVLDVVHGKLPSSSGSHAAQDWMGDYYNKQLKPAIDAWEPEAGNPIAAGAQGGTMLALTKLPYVGQVAAAAMAAGTFTRSMTNAMDEGQTATQAVSGATVDALATLAIMKFVGKEGVGLGSIPYAWVRRAIAAVPISDVIGLGQDLAKKEILEHTGNHAAAEKINPVDKLTDVGNIIQNEIFAILGGAAHGQQGEHQNGPKPPEPSPVKPAAGVAPTPPTPEGKEVPPPPPEPKAAAEPKSPETPTSQVSAVPDHPTGEPAKQLRAQLTDMNRSATPRNGVLITPESWEHLGTLGEDHPQAGPVLNQIEQALQQGRVVETPVGDLITKTRALAASAKADLNAGKDPQEVIGRITVGSDGPKRPDQTQVVQSLEPHDGAVTSERAVSPAERDPAMQEAIDSGKVPRVATPGAVLHDRQESMAKELPAPGADTARPEIAAPAPSGEADSAKPGFFKPDHGPEIPVHVLPDGRIQRLNDNGEPMGEPMQVPANRIRTGAEPAEPAPKPEPVPETKPGQTALEQLPAVLATHERAEAVPEGKKKAASLKERQDNASAVADALQKAAVEAKEKGAASEAAIERANEAAKAAKGLTNISRENTVKGRGTGHVQVTAKVSEMHKAARGLLGEARPGDEVRESPKEAVKKKQMAKKAEAVREVVKEAINGGTEAILKKPTQKKEPEKKKTTVAERTLTKQMLEGYMRAKTPEGAQRRRDELEEHLQAVADRLGQPRDTVMEFLRGVDEERQAAAGRKMSDTVEEEQHEFERPETGFESVYAPSRGGDKAGGMQWNAVTKKLKSDFGDFGDVLERGGFLNRMRAMEDTGRPMSARRVLEEMIQHANAAGLKSPIVEHAKHILAQLPDVPLYSRSTIIKPPTGARFSEDTRGLFQADPDHPNVQVNFGNNRSAGSIVHTVLHELRHAAQMLELHNNRQGELATAARHARDILERRMRALFGDTNVSQHLAYFRDTKGEVDRPADYHPEWYGMQDEREMMAELVNPMFVEHVIHSEMVRTAGENLPTPRGMPTLLHFIKRAVARFFGYRGDDGPTLLMHLVDLDRDLAAAQRGNFGKFYGEGAFERQVVEMPQAYTENLAGARGDPFGELMRPSPNIKAEGMSAHIVGDEGVKTAKDTAHAIASGAIDKVRRSVTALKTVGQIFRSQTKYFGNYDDPHNPMNELRDAHTEKEKAIMEVKRITNPVARLWQKLNNASNNRVGQLMIDTGLYKIDPRIRLSAEELAKKSPAYQKQYDEFTRRFDALTPAERAVYVGAAEANKATRAIERRTAVDTAIEGFDLKVTPAERALLYGAKDPGAFERLIGPGKLLDFGDKNDKVTSTLKDWAGGRDIEGPYFHMGRQGNYVVQAKPEGSKQFASEEEANRWADSARGMSPNSKADVEFRGGKWMVDYKVDHVSMHQTRKEAEKMRDQLERGGFEPGSVTEKNFDAGNAPLSHAMTEFMADVTRKLNRGGNPADVKPLVDSLHSAFLQMQAQRSAYAGSRLMRKGVGGVKASEMRQNFAEHATASGWHSAQLRTIFKQAAALARLRGMARDTDAPQAVAYQRGETVTALANHSAEDVNNFGKFNGFNRATARLGFLSYLASPAHAAIWMTQNGYGIAVAGAHYGYGRSTTAFAHGMGATFGPAMRSAMRAAFKGGTSDDITAAIIKAIGEHPTMGKWSAAIKELHDRGVIQHGYANELGDLARGGNNKVSRAFEWARLLPSMADAFNRTSTALAGLELTGGDLRKTTDLIEQIHADYSQGNKPLAFKYAGRIRGGNSLTMMKTYVQSMAHLFYSNLAATVTGDTKQAKWEAAKTVAGMMVASTMFAGVYGAVGLEPVRLIAYAYHKLFDEEGETWDMKNAIHHWLVDHLGAGFGNALARGAIAAALGVDVQDRMGLANLFFFNPPDLMTTDKAAWGTFLMDELGALAQLGVDGVTEATGHVQNGEYAQALASLVPIKIVKDGLKSLQLMSTGKTNLRGAVQTEPSGLDAAKQLFGLKPANVAAAQEKAGVMAQYSKNEEVARTNILRALAAQKDGALDRRDSFNQRFPNRKITAGDVEAYRRGTVRQEAGVTKDRRAAGAADFSGS